MGSVFHVLQVCDRLINSEIVLLTTESWQSVSYETWNNPFSIQIYVLFYMKSTLVLQLFKWFQRFFFMKPALNAGVIISFLMCSSLQACKFLTFTQLFVILVITLTLLSLLSFASAFHPLHQMNFRWILLRHSWLRCGKLQEVSKWILRSIRQYTWKINSGLQSVPLR